MFIKQFKIKNNVQLKATERKKFRAKVSAEYPTISEDVLNEIIPSKSSLYMIKVITHNLTQVTIYSVDKKPMFFEHEGKLVPTVYTLWIALDLVPEFTTHPQVFPKLSNGADLMLPGVVRKETTLASWGRFEKGQVVLVNLTSNKAAVGVGFLARSSEDLYMSAGSGVCVNVLHIYGDKLWNIEPTVCQQLPVFDAVMALPKSDDFPSLAESLSKTKITAEKGNSGAEDVKQIETEITDEVENIYDSENTPKKVPENMDDLLKTAFLNALKLGKNKLVLPLLTSNFYRLHIIPASNRPLYIKASSYKKVSKFLDHMSDQGFLIVKEETKGVEKITEIDFEHPELLSFYPTLQISKPKENNTKDETPLFTSSVAELVAVTEEVADFFRYFKIPVGTTMDKKTVLKHIKDYVGQNKLKSNDLLKTIIFDETLKRICEQNQSKDVAALNTIILSKMDVCYEMRNQPNQITPGKTPPIQMTLATRSGNKKVTLISNLDQYGIIVSEFAKACKVGAAASTSITRPPGAKTDQLLVQGNQIKFLFELLTQTYKIPPKNITGLELAKKEKKKKK